MGILALRTGIILIAMLCLSTIAMASMVDNQSSLTTDFTRMPARTAASDSSDAAIYNPAGSAWLSEGTHLGLSVKACLKDWQHSINGETFESTTPTYAVHPHGVYRNGRLGIYTGIAAFGGLGKIKYNDGFSLGMMGPYQLTFPNKTEFTYIVPGISSGVSWQVSDSLAVSGGVRLLYGLMETEVEGGSLLDLSADAVGAAPIFGISWKSTDRLDISLRHEMRTRMEYKVDTLKGSHPLMPLVNVLMEEGDKFRQDFPAQTAIGVLYRITPELRVAVDGTVAWQKDADRGGAEDGMGNGYYIASGIEYDINDKWTVSGGHIYCDPKDDLDRVPYLTVNPKLAYHALAAGCKYKHNDALSFSFGIAPYFYDSETNLQGVKLEKHTTDISFGIEWML